MKKFCGLVAFLLTAVWTTASFGQTPAPQYSNVWRPITVQGIQEGIARNRNNGVGLGQTMMRALLQQKGLEYLTAIKAASDVQPKNGTLLAAYVWALVQVRNSYRFNSLSAPVPPSVSQKFNFNDQYLLNTLQRSKELNTRNWLAYIVQSSMEPGGLIGQPSKSAAASKKAFAIQRNALTLTQYGSDLVFQGALLYGKDRQEAERQATEGLRLLKMAQRFYPTYYKVPYEIYNAYGSSLIANPEEQQAALRRFYETIPPEYRKALWVRRYLNYLDLSRPLAQIGVTL